MRVFVRNKRGKPLMPCSPAKSRLLLKEKKAIVVRRTPFTIQLTIATGETKQPVSLGVDAGYKHVGLSASTEKAELYASEIELRQDITDLLSARRALRQSRRNRKTRYRAPRFDNRIRTKRKGWLAPSVENRINSHLSRIEAVLRLLPVTKITVETASFDLQLLKNPNISGKEYQEGEQLGFWNIREYVLCRDGHVCQHCYGRSKDPVLNVHHLESRRTGGDSPGNLITLCETCHKALHRGELTLKAKRGQSFRAEAFMGIMRWEVLNRLKASHPELEVNNTYGYRTKHARIANGIAKSHCADASASPATSAPKGSANSSSRSRRVGTTGRFTNFPSSKADFESAIRLPLRSMASVFLTRLPAREKKASFSAVDHRGSLMFENLTEPAFQPASAARSCICWKRDKLI
ncbi:MAG: RNA-guided endonuclease IscB [Parasutterella sp.]